MMSVVRPRGSRASARTLTVLVSGFTALLAGCGTRSTASLGTPVITLAHTSSDFAAYRVAIDPNSITLTDTNGGIVPSLSQQQTSHNVHLPPPPAPTEP